MPKQVYKINRFDGGINDNASARDISDSEVTSIKNGSVDSIGKVEAMPYGVETLLTADGASITSASGNRMTIVQNKINLGEGLFLFSSDYTGAQTLTTGTHTGSDGDAFILDTTNRFVDDELNNAKAYNITQNTTSTISDTLDTGSAGKLAGGSYDTSDSYKVYKTKALQAAGDDYLCIPKIDSSTGGIFIKSRKSGNSSAAVITFNTNTAIKPQYYSADGILRVCDSAFLSGNNNKWYGFIDRKLFEPTIYDVDIETWCVEESEPSIPEWTSVLSSGAAISSPPSSKTFTDNIAVTNANNATGYASNTDAINTGSGDTSTDKSQADLAASSGMGGDDVNRVVVTVETTGYTTQQSWTLNAVFRIGQKNASTTWQSTGYQYQVITLTNTVIGKDEENIADVSRTFELAWSGSDFAINSNNALYSLRHLSSSGDGGFNAGTPRITSITFHGGGTGDEAYTSSTDSVAVVIGDSNIASDDWAADWNVGTSFEYDGNQESLVRQLSVDGVSTVTLTKAPYCNVSLAHTRGWNQRITGVNIYMKKDSETDWLLHAKIDLKTSEIYRLGDAQRQSSAYNITNSAHLYQLGGDVSEDVPIFTYEAHSGVSQDSPSLTAKFKTAAISNRRAYIGNVEMKDEMGVTRLFPDRIVKSPVNKFDIFPLDNVIDAVINDGESIVALVAFGDKLLQFKERTLYILNISGKYEVLESSHKFRGVENQGAVTSTEFGVVWANKYGAFFYDGNQIRNLLEKKGIRTISETSWTAFYTQKSLISYVPQKRQVIVTSSYAAAADSGNSYVYDFVTSSWAFYDDFFGTDSTGISNIVNSWDGHLVYLENTTSNITLKRKTLADTSSSAFELITKEIDFGNPASRKNIYDFHISYIGGTSQDARLYYRADGGSWVSELGDELITNGTFDTNTSSWGADSTATLSVVSNQLVMTAIAGDPSVPHARAFQSFATEVGKTYRVTGNFIKGSADAGEVHISDDSSFQGNYRAYTASMTSTQAFDFTFIATQTTHHILLHDTSVAQTIDDTTIWDNISIKLVAQLNSTSTSQTMIKFSPQDFVQNAKSVQLKFDGTISSTFELNDLGIVYREKRVV